MPNKYSIIGEFLKKKRLKAGLSQKEVGEKLGYGSSQFISNIERGEASIPPKMLKKLINILNMSEREVLRVMLQEHETFLRRQMGLKNHDRSM